MRNIFLTKIKLPFLFDGACRCSSALQAALEIPNGYIPIPNSLSICAFPCVFLDSSCCNHAAGPTNQI